MGRQLCGGEIAADDAGPWCDWTLAEVALGTVIGEARQGRFEARRESRLLLRDGDDAVSIFIGRRGEACLEQNDRRVRM
ncbi:MAG: hypothetical protein ACRYG4_25000 [Janthinobacterium lividum]